MGNIVVVRNGKCVVRVRMCQVAGAGGYCGSEFWGLNCRGSQGLGLWRQHPEG